MTYYNKQQSCKPRRKIVTSATLPEIYNSLWHMSETEPVYFSLTVTTSSTIYLRRRLNTLQSVISVLCVTSSLASDDTNKMTKLWLQNQIHQRLLMWRMRESPPDSAWSFFYACFHSSIDILNMRSWLQVNDSKCNRKEQALLFALRRPSA